MWLYYLSDILTYLAFYKNRFEQDFSAIKFQRATHIIFIVALAVYFSFYGFHIYHAVVSPASVKN